nr:MAG TPA: hypothetical protein [Caudoviricetes sp.]
MCIDTIKKVRCKRMLKYHEFNVNPKNRKTGDCSTRALVSTLEITYEEALKLQCEEAIKSCYGITDKQIMQRILKKFGYVKMKQPKKSNGKKYMVKELDEIISKKIRNKGVFITIANHHTCVKGDMIIDIWDCSDNTIGNYYIKN